MIFKFYTGLQNPCVLQFGNPPVGQKWYIDFLDIQKVHTARTGNGTIRLYTTRDKDTTPTETIGDKNAKQARLQVHWQDYTAWINNEGTEALFINDHRQFRIEQDIPKNMNFIGIYTDGSFYGYVYGFVKFYLVKAGIKRRFGDID